MISSEPRFILGLGAQKSGTTWLYSYLEKDEKAALVRPKEMHVWDTLHVPANARFREFAEPRLHRRIFHTLRGKKQPWQVRRTFLKDPQNYFDFFAAKVSQPQKRITADITPTYMECDASVLKKIRSGFEARGVAVKPVLLLRDLVERCWSHLKMLMKSNRDTMLFEKVTDPQSQFAKFCQGAEAQLRTNYPFAIRTMREVFGEEGSYLGLYETMFSAEEIERLSAFLGIEARPEAGNVRVHGGSSLKLSEIARSEAREVLDDIYEQTADLLPQVREVWQY